MYIVMAYPNSPILYFSDFLLVRVANRPPPLDLAFRSMLAVGSYHFIDFFLPLAWALWSAALTFRFSSSPT